MQCAAIGRVPTARRLRELAAHGPMAVAASLVFLLAADTSPTAAAPSAGIHNIQHVVMIMQENRSFDSYFGTYPGADGIPGGTCVHDPSSGGCVRPYHTSADSNVGGPHSSRNAVLDINGGKMDGFLEQVEKAPSCDQTSPRCSGCIPSLPETCREVMGYHDAREIPNYWTYAQNFVLQDNMFASSLSWSQPEHNYLVSGWSAYCPSGSTDPLLCTNDVQMGSHERNWTDITYLLHKANVSWRYYVYEGSEPDCESDEDVTCQPTKQTPTTPGIWNPLRNFTDVKEDGELGNIQSLTNFYSAVHDTSQCGLANVTWIDPNQEVSEHPPSLVSAGQAYVTTLINAIMRSPCWASTAIFLSWDDWGGLYDHVVPPNVDVNGYGLRVPGLVLSPYAKANYVDHQQLSHDAYLKFIEDDFLGGARLNPATDGRPDKRTDVREEAPGLGDLASDFNFDQPPRQPLLLPAHPAPGPASKPPAGSTPDVVTGVASSVTQASATLRATVNPNGSGVTDCHFEYGATLSYGNSVPCTEQPGSGEGPVAVDATVALPSARTTYGYRIAAANSYGTSLGSDKLVLEAPEFGQCAHVTPEKEGTKTVFHGRFIELGNCATISKNKTGRAEWYRGAVNAGFTTMLIGAAMKLEAVNHAKVTCTSESGTGVVSGAKTLASVVVTLKGCESAATKCTTPGLAEGHLETKTLEGALGWENKSLGKVALDLYPAGKTGPVVEYRCGGGALTTLKGSVLVPATAGKRDTKAALHFTASAGRQTPEGFEGGEQDVLTNALNEQVGLTLSSTQTYEEPIEINAAF